MSHMCIDAATRAASDLGYRTTVVHDACATRDLEFDGQVVPAAQVHNAYMSALAFAYAKVTTADEYLAEPAASAARIPITPQARPDEATPPDRTARRLDGLRPRDGAPGNSPGGRASHLPDTRERKSVM